MLPRRCRALLRLILLSAIHQVVAHRVNDGRTVSGGLPGRGMALMHKIAEASRANTGRDMARALKAFGNNGKRLAAAESAVLSAPIIIVMPFSTWNTTFTQGLGFVNKDVALEEAAAKNDEPLLKLLVDNEDERGFAYRARAEVEDRIAKENLSFEDRPVYGALDLAGAADLLISSMYGEIQLVLKREVMGRVTLTAGDSHDLSLTRWGLGVRHATEHNPYPLFTDSTEDSSSEELRAESSGFVEAQIWRGGQARPVEFDKDVEKIRLSHAGVKQLVRRSMTPGGPKKDEYLRVFDNIMNFAHKHKLPFEDEDRKAWTKNAFQQELEQHHHPAVTA